VFGILIILILGFASYPQIAFGGIECEGRPDGTTCGGGPGICLPEFVCDNGSCVASFAPVGTECASGDGVCDGADSCDGAGSCIDLFVPAGIPCGPGFGTCESATACDGSGSCSVPVYEPVGTICGPGFGACTPAEECDGSGSCDVVYAPLGTTCGPGFGACTPAEECDGAGFCDVVFAPSGTTCGGGTGICQPTDECDGGGSCDPVFEPAGFVCNSGSGDSCNPDEVCDGFSADCPTDVKSNVGDACTCGGLSGECNASFVCEGEVSIDIKPNDGKNTISIKNDKSVRVAILGTAIFDVTLIDVTPLADAPEFGPESGGTPRAPVSFIYDDVNGDGEIDLVLKYNSGKANPLGFASTEDMGCIFNGTLSAGGQPVTGCDIVRIVK